MEAMRLEVASPLASGGVEYAVHAANIGWMAWEADGAQAGTTGQARQLEAVRMRLTGDLANAFDLYYRAHIAGYGWLGWAANGADAGSSRCGIRMEAVEVRLVPKGASAPGQTTGAFFDTRPISINGMYFANLDHGSKGAAYQKYIMLHDTEGEGSPQSVISWWAGNGNQVAAHFVIGKDGSIWQCVPMDRIAHHAGYGNTGNNALFGVAEDGRDDMRGTSWVGPWAADYGMNAYSIGIELVHVGGSGWYPEAQLQALDSLIAYIDSYYGFQSAITDHKAWRSGNSDTSPEFARYLANYQDHRTHL
ncbi:MAG: N-acetylmuramoyl-L-alanine amidase, partial [Coriobacteriaceae bacterium]|jgi:hypothetical protein|nr:N-acetylmuramoyl-L-alanine amidase [Coriobacteriaceae bacterium]